MYMGLEILIDMHTLLCAKTSAYVADAVGEEHNQIFNQSMNQELILESYSKDDNRDSKHVGKKQS